VNFNFRLVFKTQNRVFSTFETVTSHLIIKRN